MTIALPVGDYSLYGCEEDDVAIERKTVSDLVGVTMGKNRERFERELRRMRDMRFRRLLIVGSKKEVEEGNYHSNIDPKSVLNSLKAWEVRYLIPVVWVGTPEAAAKKVEGWLYWCARHIAEKANNLFRGCRDGVDDS